MLVKAEIIYRELEASLKSVAEDGGSLSRAELSISICDKALVELKDLVVKGKFKNQQEEIYFFKKVKPKFSSKLIYNAMLFDLESRRPVSSPKAILMYLENVQTKIDTYLQENMEFYTYYRTDSTLFDDKYFVRDKMDLRLVMEEKYFSYDRDFSTNRDIKQARLIANEMLSIYISAEVKRIEMEQLGVFSSGNSGLNWTESKVNLVLLIYALHTASCLNGGNIDIKELASKLSQFLNVELSDVYRTWSEIKLKKDPTKFLEILKMAVDDRIIADMQ